MKVAGVPAVTEHQNGFYGVRGVRSRDLPATFNLIKNKDIVAEVIAGQRSEPTSHLSRKLISKLQNVFSLTSF